MIGKTVDIAEPGDLYGGLARMSVVNRYTAKSSDRQNSIQIEQSRKRGVTLRDGPVGVVGRRGSQRMSQCGCDPSYHQ